MNNVVGADIGGSHISSAVINLETGKFLDETFCALTVNNKASAGEILRIWAECLTKTISIAGKENISGIGFAMPGPFDYVKGTALFKRVDKYESLYGVKILQNLRLLTGLPEDIPIRFMNDATSFAVGEAWIGEAAGFDRVISLTLGTGFGSAFTDSGIPVVERDDVPEMGCLWHLPYKEGIADDYFSTRWFVNNYKLNTGILLHGVKEIAAKAPIDPAAYNLFVEFGLNLGQFLNTYIKNFLAGVIVLGGNITESFNLFGTSFVSALKDHDANIPIVFSRLKEKAAISGSARLLDKAFWEKTKTLLGKM